MIVGIYKPKGPTSHDIINQIRRITHERRVGHAGTLDPMASGVLVIAITRESTKQLPKIVEADKEYTATIQLDGTSTTDDAEGEITPISNRPSPLSHEEIKTIVMKFVGEIKQAPPAFSAIKVGGKKAYDLARHGHLVNLGLRDVTVQAIEVMDYRWPELTIKVHCGKGVYIRSLARDIGLALGVGGYLSRLERIRVGRYRIEDSMTVEEFEKHWHETDAG